MAHPFTFIIHEISKQKCLAYLDQTVSKNGQNEMMDENLWKNLNKKCFNLIYLRDSRSYVIIFRHLDRDEVDELSDIHTKECLTGCKPRDKSPSPSPRYVTENIVELFSTAPLSKRFLENIKAKYPNIIFEYCHVERKNRMSDEKEALFIILVRLFNFDQHHEEIEEELSRTNLAEREEFISSD